ncbi:MAG: cytidine deaminase [Anaerofustis stercorihominis]|nr:cytidine deaminase [Anaerofustis stercorihominis]
MKEILLKKAVEMLEMSYSPYSNYRVGAAILTESGKIYTGCNIENASYGATICAERTAAVKAVSEGEKKFKAIAIACSGNTFAYPCGICRQFLYEFSDSEMKLYLIKADGETAETYFEQTLPNGFRGSDME